MYTQKTRGTGLIDQKKESKFFLFYLTAVLFKPIHIVQNERLIHILLLKIRSSKIY